MSIRSPFTTAVERGAYTAIVYKEGDLYVAKDAIGNIIIENSNAATVIQKAIDDYASDGLVIVDADLTLTQTLKIEKTRSSVELLGVIYVSTGVTAIKIGDEAKDAGGVKLWIRYLDGQDKTGHGIELKNVSGGIIEYGMITNFDIGLYFNPSATGIAGENRLEGGYLSSCGTAGIRFSTSSRSMEGNHFSVSIFGCPIGIDLLAGGSSGYQTVLGVSDNIAVANSEDIKDLVGKQIFLTDFVRRETCTIHKSSLLLNSNCFNYDSAILEMRAAHMEIANVGFVPYLIWDFNRDSTADWSKTQCTMSTPAKSVTRVTQSGSADNWIDRIVEVDGGKSQLIIIRYKYVSGTVPAGLILYATSGHGFNGSYQKGFKWILDGEWHIVVLDMSDLTAGGTDWIDNTITELRVDVIDAGSSGIMDIDYIAIGTRAYASMYNLDDALLTPASASAQGNKGDVRWDTSYIYICTAADTWKRVAIATW